MPRSVNRVLNQAVHVEQAQSRISMSAEKVERYLKFIEDERQKISNKISRMEDSKIGILIVDGQVAKMEFEQSSASDLMGRRTVPICQRHNGTESKEKPLISSVSSVSGDEDATHTHGER
nr:hypothetical protein HmN_000723600 [Hymenolepis microstoma]